MAKPTVGLDLDGVIYQWADTARYLIRIHHSIALPESTYWEYIKDNVPQEVWSWLWDRGVDLGLFRYGHVYSGAIDGIRELQHEVDLHIVTHRPRSAINDTLAFLSYITGTPELRDAFRGVHMLSDEQPKSSVGMDIYVDDAPHVVQDVIRQGARAVLVDRPWNQRVVIETDCLHLAERALDWPHIVAAVRRFAA
jgi:5'(3')-deoxyribonucleotidase